MATLEGSQLNVSGYIHINTDLELGPGEASWLLEQLLEYHPRLADAVL